MSGKFKFEYVTFIASPEDGAGTVRFRGQVLVGGVTGVEWSGGGLRASTTKGAKLVQFKDDGTVQVEDVVSDPRRAMNKDALSAVAQQVHNYFGATEPAEAEESGRDTAARLGPR